jgi:hypothetical protein
MLEATDSKHAPWHIVVSNDKRRGRLNAISHILSLITPTTSFGFNRSARELVIPLPGVYARSGAELAGLRLASLAAEPRFALPQGSTSRIPLELPYRLELLEPLY